METQNKKDGVCVASLVCGIVGLCCCNPLYLVSLAAIITGIVALVSNKNPRGMAVAGLVLGIVSVVIWIVLDSVLAVFTAGLSFFV